MIDKAPLKKQLEFDPEGTSEEYTQVMEALGKLKVPEPPGENVHIIMERAERRILISDFIKSFLLVFVFVLICTLALILDEGIQWLEIYANELAGVLFLSGLIAIYQFMDQIFIRDKYLPGNGVSNS